MRGYTNGNLTMEAFQPKATAKAPTEVHTWDTACGAGRRMQSGKMVKDEINAKGTGALNLHFMDEWLVRLLNATMEVDNSKEVANALDSTLNTRKPPIRRPSTVSDHMVLMPLIAGSRKPQKAKISMANSSIR